MDGATKGSLSNDAAFVGAATHGADHVINAAGAMPASSGNITPGMRRRNRHAWRCLSVFCFIIFHSNHGTPLPAGRQTPEIYEGVRVNGFGLS
jgi:hypothetical protein